MFLIELSAVESNEASFLAKEKENTLKILSYKATFEENKRAKDEQKRKLEELRKQNKKDAQYKRSLRLTKE